jgi:hypothetical protein
MSGGGQQIADTRRQHSSGMGKQEVSGGIQKPPFGLFTFPSVLRLKFSIFHEPRLTAPSHASMSQMFSNLIRFLNNNFNACIFK